MGIWAIFTAEHADETRDALESMSMLDLCAHKGVSRQITISHVGKNDICEVHIGKLVTDRLLFPSKRLKQLMAEYLQNNGHLQMRPHFEPAGGQEVTTHRTASEVTSMPTTQRTA